MKRIIIFLLSVSLPVFVFAQGGGMPRPNVVPPSPQAQEIMKYIDYPVNLTTGVPEINVPIYTIKSKELTLPISLSYHASGFKPNEKDGYVGQHWTLNAGGRISRTINSAPDEKNLSNLIKNEGDFLHHCDNKVGSSCMDTKSDPEAYYLRDIAGLNVPTDPDDAEYDIFYYNLPGQGGKFIFERDAQFSFKPVTLPYKPIVIKTYGTSTDLNNKITHFEITDENGVYYRFGRSIGTTNDINEKSKSYDFYGRETRGSGITSWLLTEIISADKTDTIFFEYTIPSTYIVENHHPFNKSITQTTGTNADWGLVDTNGMTGYTQYSYTQGRLSRIKFRNGEVRFSYLTGSKIRLDKIDIYEENSINPIKSIKLELSPYVAGSSHWYKLDAVKFQDKNSADIQEYSFLYYPSDSPNDKKTFPTMVSHTLGGSTSYETYSIDYWGFYNGAENDMLLAKANPIDAYSTHPRLRHLFGTADRSPNPDYAKVGVLRQITYPTGGTTTYEYEGNKTVYGVNLGGLRVKKIIHSAGSESLTHTYEYEASTSSVGEPVSFYNDIACFKSASYTSEGLYYTATYTNSASPQVDYNLNAQPVTYYRVIEYFGDAQTNTGRIEYTFDMEPAMSNLDIVPDEFPSYEMDPYYPWYGLDLAGIDLNYGGGVFYQKNYRYGEIFERQKVIYDANGDPRKKIESNYTHDLKNTYSGLYAKKLFTNSFKGDILKNHYFWKRNYTIEQLSQRLDNVVVTEYPDNSGKTVITTNSYTYTYNNFPKEELIEKSDGKKIKTTFTYPNEESCTNCPAMVSRNILSPVINKKEYLKSTTSEQLLSTLYTNYDQYGKPLLIKTATGSSPLQDELVYTYDTKTQNLKTVQKPRNTIVSYLWGYGATLPMAKTVNAAENEIAYTSFESADSKGNWNYAHQETISPECQNSCENSCTNTAQQSCAGSCSSTCNGDPNCYSSCMSGCVSGVYGSCMTGCMNGCSSTITINVTDGKTGKQSFKGSGASIGGLPTGYYKVSYWVKKTGSSNGTVTINGSSTTISSSNWEYKEFTTTSAVTNLAVTLSGVYLDELRLYPIDAQMTTYTYDPLIGMTSQCDENGIVTTFEYDDFGRLKTVRDDDGNILSHTDYKYKQ